jgi:outer membrane protein assembly factor BamB
MKHRQALVCCSVAWLAGAAERPGADWPTFRGPTASGVAEGWRTPLRWDVPSSRGLRWRTAIPGLGHSSPVVLGDLVCVTSAASGQAEPELKLGLYGDIRSVDDPSVHAYRVHCLDRKTGKVRWERTARAEVPRIKRHTKATHANPTMALARGYAVAMFGSEGLHVYDDTGKPLWSKDLGVLDSGFFRVREAQWGFGSSPVIHDGKVIVQADVQAGSFLAAFDLRSGRELWRTPRADVPTWSTPTVVGQGAELQVVVNGFRRAGGYDLATGRERWRLQGGGDIPVPTPVSALGLVFLTSAHGGQAPIYAVRETARGDVSLKPGETAGEHVAWSQARDGAYMQTPLVYGGRLYNCRDNGVLSAYEAATGARLYQERLGDGKTGFTASAVAGDGRLYYTSEDGDVFVVKAGPAFEVLSRNALGEPAMATPALSEGVLYFRTRGHVLAVEDETTRAGRASR